MIEHRAPTTRQALRERRAFTFVELLFAIMLLAIGFIMVAASLPTAIVQSQETMDQTIAAQVAKGASEVVETIADDSTMPQTMHYLAGLGRSPVTAPVWSLADRSKYPPGESARAWALLKGKMIHAADPRYAWTAVYSREYNGALTKAAPYAQLFVIVTRNRLRERFTMDDLVGERPNLRPREVDVKLTEGTLNGVAAPDIIEFSRAFTGDYDDVDTRLAVAEGTFVVIAEDKQTTVKFRYNTRSSPSYQADGLANGRVYRVGTRRPDLGEHAWELMPGWDMPHGPGCGGPGPDLVMNTDDDNQNLPIVRNNPRLALPARAFIMGRSSVDPTDAREFDGPAMDVALFTTFVPVYR
jgi:type II secretory pathway pseudopilin PulG